MENLKFQNSRKQNHDNVIVVDCKFEYQFDYFYVSLALVKEVAMKNICIDLWGENTMIVSQCFF